ncbi:hypothetical protein [Flavobacterium sp. 9AF]|uniref:hypothetical protein n=1 Tax=Flavobacterium sp. 9AF TaxID=2653142 RepID=UPI001357B4C0|nr:hypothetical protein [Flavobacterium sp. 9AF]
MKRILAIFVLFFAFGLSSYAQERNENFVTLAKKDSKDVVTLLQLGDKEEIDFFNLFYYKYDEQSKTSSDERKKVIANVITKKLEASLTAENFDKLKRNTALFERVIN